MTYESPDFANRTAVYEDLVRLYFSHPAVEGILFWVISNNGWRPDAAILDSAMKVSQISSNEENCNTHSKKNSILFERFHGVRPS